MSSCQPIVHVRKHSPPLLQNGLADMCCIVHNIYTTATPTWRDTEKTPASIPIHAATAMLCGMEVPPHIFIPRAWGAAMWDPCYSERFYAWAAGTAAWVPVALLPMNLRMPGDGLSLVHPPGHG